jgi:hypothetical protein
MKRPDDLSRRRILWQTLRSWDLAIAVAAGLVMFAVALWRDDFRGEKPYLVALVPIGFTVAAAALVIGRWIADHLRDDYGELVRVVDPEGHALYLPYQVVGVVSVSAATWSALALIFYDWADATWAAPSSSRRP